MESETPYEYEVDLRDYIHVIWKKKWLILLIFILAVGAAFGFSTMKATQSRTSTSVTISPTKGLRKYVDDDLEKFIKNQLSLSAFQELATSQPVLEKALTEVEVEDLTPDTLARKMDTTLQEEKQGTSAILRMTITGTEPKRLKKLADAWAISFQKTGNETYVRELDHYHQLLASQLTSLENRLQEKTAALVSYRREHPLDQIEIELDEMKYTYRNYLDDLHRLRAELNRDQNRLSSTEQALKEEPKYIEPNRTITSEALWSFLIKAGGLSERMVNQESIQNLPDLTLKDQEKNEVYFSLKKQLIDLRVSHAASEKQIEYLQKRVETLSEEMVAKQVEIEKYQPRLNQLDEQIEKLRKLGGQLSSDLMELETLQSAKGDSIRILKEATVPQVAVSKDTRTNVAVAGVLGLFLGVLLAFFKHYMEGYEPPTEESENSSPDE